MTRHINCCFKHNYAIKPISEVATMRVTPYIFLLTCIVVGMSDALYRNSGFLFQHADFFHPGPVYKNITVTTPMRCFQHCMRDLACVSINFNRTSHQCILLGEIWEDGDLMEDPNTDFYGNINLNCRIVFFLTRIGYSVVYFQRFCGNACLHPATI